jgi:short-chain Z-isoprenyl diphosphate synthase
VGLSDVLYGAYERRLLRQIPPDRRPRHVGVILDGNRRWATSQGSASEAGHRAGAAKIVEFLGWCEEADVEVVTLWLLSTDNLTRPEAELQALQGIIEETVTGLAETGRWRIHPVGALDLLPDRTARLLKQDDLLQRARLNDREGLGHRDLCREGTETRPGVAAC